MTIAFSASAQIKTPIFGHISYRSPAVGQRVAARVTATDSTFWAVRPLIIPAAFSVPDNHLMAGAAITIQNITYNYATGKSYANVSFALVGFAGGNVVPTKQSDVVSYGAMVFALNNVVGFGAVLNSGNVNFVLSYAISLN